MYTQVEHSTYVFHLHCLWVKVIPIARSTKHIYYVKINTPNTGKFTKRVREMSYKLFITIYTLSVYSSAHKQMRRHLLNPFREFPCINGEEQILFLRWVRLGLHNGGRTLRLGRLGGRALRLDRCPTSEKRT